jgi:hypothetical protein
MYTIWAVILTILTGVAFIGQFISALWPKTAAAAGLAERETEVGPTFYADARGEAFWDAAVLWTLPAAGVLMLLKSHLWVWFGLIGGPMYLYFAGRGIVVRLSLKKRSIRIGSNQTVATALIFLALWGASAAVTIALGIYTLLQG